jgi:carbon starvation protein
VSLLPLTWLLTVTMSAGLMKIFSADPRLGFLSNAAALQKQIAAGGTAAQLKEWSQLVFNNHVNTAVTASFLVLVTLVVLASARVWWQLLSGRRAPDLHEEPYVAVAGATVN